MHERHDTPRADPETVLRGIFALLLAERLERQDAGSRHAERILASAGLDAEQITALTGRDLAQPPVNLNERPTIGYPALPWHPAIKNPTGARTADERAPRPERRPS
jgi:hypothetical protein